MTSFVLGVAYSIVYLRFDSFLAIIKLPGGCTLNQRTQGNQRHHERRCARTRRWQAILQEAAQMPNTIAWFRAATNGKRLLTRRVITIAASEYPAPGPPSCLFGSLECKIQSSPQDPATRLAGTIEKGFFAEQFRKQTLSRGTPSTVSLANAWR
jgi:hypothetical protein